MTIESRVHRSGPRGLTVPVPAAVRDGLSLSPGTTVAWTISPDGRSATLSFSTEAPA